MEEDHGEASAKLVVVEEDHHNNQKADDEVVTPDDHGGNDAVAQVSVVVMKVIESIMEPSLRFHCKCTLIA